MNSWLLQVPYLYFSSFLPKMAAANIINRWFDSEPLKSTLATDAVIGAMIGPSTPGSLYSLVLLTLSMFQRQRLCSVASCNGRSGWSEGNMGLC
jgi:hypothetical protein